MMDGAGVVGGWGVEGVNENGEHLVDICAERGLFLSNTFFQHKMIHRYKWARGNERSMIDYITVDNRLRKEVDISTRQGLNSHYTGEKYQISQISELDFINLPSLFLNMATLSLSTAVGGSEFHALTTLLKKSCFAS